MKPFTFSVPQNIIVGKGSLNQLPEIGGKLGTHAFLISGPHLNKMGIVKGCADKLEAAGIQVDCFTETEGNPSVETVDKAAAAFRSSGADFIVADKVAQAKDARIVSKGDCVVLVIAGVGGPDYADIDTAIAAALN